ncbi:hypothetical protein HF086_000751, partial [Spodoptera exigua]
AQFFEDRRCRCVCPSPAAVLNTSSTRQIYTGNVPPNLWCDCVYQTRNTSFIMAVVFMIIISVMVLILYTIAIWMLKIVLWRHKRTIFRTPEPTQTPQPTERTSEEVSTYLNKITLILDFSYSVIGDCDYYGDTQEF